MKLNGERTDVCELTVGNLDQVFLVVDTTIHETRNGDPYLRANLCDRTGELPAIQWDTDEAPDVGLYRVEGMVETYEGCLQAKVRSMVEAAGDVSEFVPASEFGRDDMSEALDVWLDDIGGGYGEVVAAIFDDEDVRERFLEAPAATSNHHAYVRGLVEHTVSMLEHADNIARLYQSRYGDDAVDRDLLLSGTLLHDLGKIYELEQDGPEWSRKARGELVGHIAEVIALIHDACLSCLASGDTRDRLMHMVLAHHGRNEWGAPVEPRIIEAQLLHCIDLMDSRFAMFRQNTDGLDDGEVSEWIRPLGGRVVG